MPLSSKAIDYLHSLVVSNKAGCHDKTIKFLLKDNPNIINATNQYGYTALGVLLNQRYSSENNLEDFRTTALLLAEHQADCLVGDNQKDNGLLHHLVLTNKDGGNNVAIMELLKLIPGAVNAKNRYGYTALVLLLKQWVSKGCSLDDFKKTAMLLAEHSANCRVSGYDNLNLLHHLVLANGENKNKLEIEKLLLIDKQLPLHTSMYNLIYRVPQVPVETVKHLVSLGVSLEETFLGDSLLHCASQKCHLELAQYLVDQGFSIHSVLSNGRTLLHSSASNYENEKYCNWLLSKNIDIDAQDNQGNTALHSALSAKNTAMVLWLINNKADLNIANNQDETPLEKANRLGYAELANCLLKSRAGSKKSPKQELLASLKAMKSYGSLLDKQSETKGKIVFNLADQLEKNAKAFFKEKLTSEKLKTFKNEFLPLLHNQDTLLSKHRNEWAVIIANVLIALTGLGALLIAANLAYTKATTGKAMLFFQKDKTNSERLVDKVVNSLAALSI